MKTLWLAVSGLALALIVKGAGRLYTTIHRTDATSAKSTVRSHLELMQKLFGLAALSVLLVVGVFVAPAAWTGWTLTIGLVALVVMNFALGGLSGTSGALGSYLHRPRRWNEIESQIAMKRRARRVLERFLVVLIVTSAAFPAAVVKAGDSCAIALDETVSVSDAGRNEALSFLKETIVEYAASFDCSWIVVVRFAEETRFAPRLWVETVQALPEVDCNSVEPEPLAGHMGIFERSRPLWLARKRAAVDRCLREQAEVYEQYRVATQRFLNKVATALEVSPRIAKSRISEVIENLAGSDLYRHLVSVTDGVDNPPTPLRKLRVPEDVGVLMILAEPNPRYASRETVLKRATEWAEVPNVTVVTTSELHPGLWATLSEE